MVEPRVIRLKNKIIWISLCLDRKRTFQIIMKNIRTQANQYETDRIFMMCKNIFCCTISIIQILASQSKIHTFIRKSVNINTKFCIGNTCREKMVQSFFLWDERCVTGQWRLMSMSFKKKYSSSGYP